MYGTPGPSRIRRLRWSPASCRRVRPPVPSATMPRKSPRSRRRNEPKSRVPKSRRSRATPRRARPKSRHASATAARRHSPKGARPVARRVAARAKPRTKSPRVARARWKPPEPERVAAVLERLAGMYPEATTALRHENALQLLIATILSAQCTDERVNMVTPSLFARFPDARALAEADRAELEDLIRSTGFYRNKAKAIQACCAEIVSQHRGEVPRTLAALTALRGVGRKTANVVLGNAFDVPGLVVDTLLGHESVATVEGADAAFWNPAAIGTRYRSDLLLSLTDRELGPSRTRIAWTGPIGGLAVESEHGGPTATTAAAGGGGRLLRLGLSATRFTGGVSGERVIDWSAGLLARPAPWLSLGATSAHLGEPSLGGVTLHRLHTGGIGVR